MVLKRRSLLVLIALIVLTALFLQDADRHEKGRRHSET
jgi:hypothetical protein